MRLKFLPPALSRLALLLVVLCLPASPILAGIDSDLRQMALGETKVEKGNFPKDNPVLTLSLTCPQTWRNSSENTTYIPIFLRSPSEAQQWFGGVFAKDSPLPSWNSEDITTIDLREVDRIIWDLVVPGQVLASRFTIIAAQPCIEIETRLPPSEKRKRGGFTISYYFSAKGGTLSFLGCLARDEDDSDAEFAQKWEKSKTLFRAMADSMRFEKGGAPAPLVDSKKAPPKTAAPKPSAGSSPARKSLQDIVADYSSQESDDAPSEPADREETVSASSEETPSPTPRQTTLSQPTQTAEKTLPPSVRKVNETSERGKAAAAETYLISDIGVPALLVLVLLGLIGWLTWKLL